MIKKSTAFIFAILTGALGLFIGVNMQNCLDNNLLLSILILLNALLIISTIK